VESKNRAPISVNVRATVPMSYLVVQVRGAYKRGGFAPHLGKRKAWLCADRTGFQLSLPSAGANRSSCASLDTRTKRKMSGLVPFFVVGWWVISYCLAGFRLLASSCLICSYRRPSRKICIARPRSKLAGILSRFSGLFQKKKLCSGAIMCR
jgi:hypothetical protein